MEVVRQELCVDDSLWLLFQCGLLKVNTAAGYGSVCKCVVGVLSSAA